MNAVSNFWFFHLYFIYLISLSLCQGHGSVRQLLWIAAEWFFVVVADMSTYVDCLVAVKVAWENGPATIEYATRIDLPHHARLVCTNSVIANHGDATGSSQYPGSDGEDDGQDGRKDTSEPSAVVLFSDTSVAVVGLVRDNCDKKCCLSFLHV